MLSKTPKLGADVRKPGWFFVGLIVVMILLVGMFWTSLHLNSLIAVSDGGYPSTEQDAAGHSAGDSMTLASSSDPGSDEVPPEVLAAGGDTADVLPTSVPGNTMQYFIPTDNDASATVLYLYNTSTVTQTVPLRGFSYNGVVVYSLNISIKPTSFLRLSSDSIAAAPPPSWATPAPIITNFTDFTYFASVDLPSGVKVEGYTLFNPGTGVVDPRADQGSVRLRFSTDLASLLSTAGEGSP
jgi:hypothetical protein